MKIIEEIIKGLQIISKYDDTSICAEHDEIFACSDEELIEVDKKDLLDMHWLEDSNGGWKHFV